MEALRVLRVSRPRRIGARHSVAGGVSVRPSWLIHHPSTVDCRGSPGERSGAVRLVHELTAPLSRPCPNFGRRDTGSIARPMRVSRGFLVVPLVLAAVAQKYPAAATLRSLLTSTASEGGRPVSEGLLESASVGRDEQFSSGENARSADAGLAARE